MNMVACTLGTGFYFISNLWQGDCQGHSCVQSLQRDSYKAVRARMQIILAGGALQAGRCLALAGTSGSVTIQLPRPAVLRSLCFAHAANIDYSSAPRQVSAHLFSSGSGGDVATRGWTRSVHGTILPPGTAGFQSCVAVPADLQVAATAVRLDVLENHGRVEFTCLYSISALGVWA